MTAPCEVRACKQARILALAFLGAALGLGASACGRSNSQQDAASSPQSAESAPAVAQAEEGTGAVDPGTEQARSDAWPDAGSPIGTDDSQLVDIGSVTISVAPGANNGVSIAVDLVFVYDAALIPAVESKASSSWFRTRDGLVASAEGALRVMSWRAVPGEDVPEAPIDFPAGAVAVYLFADYSGRDDLPQRITGAGTLAITLGESEASIDVVQ